MKKDDYINSVLSAFVGRNKAMIKDELESHIEDRMDRFVEMGYTSEQADQMAVEKMGNAEILGARMTKIHSKKTLNNICFILFFVYIGLSVALSMTFLAWGSEVCLLTLGTEYLFLFLSIISLLLANRLKSNGPAIISLLFTSIFFIGKTIFGFHSILLYGVYFIISGHIDDFIIISQLQNGITSNLLLVLTIIFYSLWIISYVFTFINIYKFDKLKYSKKDVFRESIFKKSIILVLILFAAATAVLFGFKLSDGIGDHLDGTSHSYYDEVCIIESDELCDIKEGYYASVSSPQSLYKRYDWSSMYASSKGYKLISYDCIGSARAYNNALSYSFYTLKSQYVNSKKYVTAIPVHFDDDTPIPCFDSVQWYDTNEVKEITGSLNREVDPVQTDDYKIEICNVSAMTDEEAIVHVKKVIESFDITSYYFDDDDIERIAGATNSRYAGFEQKDVNTLNMHHFIMDDRIDIYIENKSGCVQFFKDNEFICEYVCS